MDIWTKLGEFFACGVMVLPLVLGFGMHSFEVFAVTLALMQVTMIGIMAGAPTAIPEVTDEDEETQRRRRR